MRKVRKREAERRYEQGSNEKGNGGERGGEIMKNRKEINRRKGS